MFATVLVTVGSDSKAMFDRTSNLFGIQKLIFDVSVFNLLSLIVLSLSSLCTVDLIH